MTEHSHSKLEEKLGYRFTDPDYLKTALCHRSFSHEQAEKTDDNERLEFLGDAVLNMVISDMLMSRFPEMSEGELSRIRASLVNENRLAAIAGNISLGGFLKLGKGESKTSGNKKKSILADAFEALIAAVYLDGGFKQVFSIVENHFSPFFDEIEKAPLLYDYKSLLQEQVQHRHQEVPVYRITGAEGPDHDKTFHVELNVSGIRSDGCGKSKKEAEQDAARRAFKILSSKNGPGASL